VKLPRYRTGDPELDEAVAALVERVADDDADQVFELVASAVRLARDHADRGDLKMANAALKEMRYSFHVFEPYRAARKVAIFGSARTQPDDPLYHQARRFAEAVAIVAHPIDDPILAAERHSRLGALLGEDREAFTLAPGEDHRHRPFHVLDASTWRPCRRVNDP